MIKAVIFDLDGVLVHTDVYHYKAWKKMAGEIGIEFNEDDNSRLRGVSRMESLEIILEKSSKKYTPKQKEALAKKKNDYYLEYLQELNPEAVSEEVRATLEFLRQRGFPLAIGSSSKNAPIILEKTGLKDYFAFVSDGNNISKSKPDPEVFLNAARGLKIEPDECLVVEDAVSGVDAGVAGNFPVAGIGDAGHDPRVFYKLEKLSDLINYLEYVVFDNINKVYPKGVHAVVDFDLTVQKKEFIVFVGPSGCGKTTTLRMLAGLEEITSGDLFINGAYSNEATAKERDVAMVFQSYALYPQMNVYKNMAFALKIRRLPKDAIDERVREAAEILEIEDLLGRRPRELSGGQRQRVALGRAIVRHAKLFLMDEPLSNLDAKLRVQMRAEIIKIHERIGATTIYVTHDQTEAMTMATRIVVMKKGIIQQIGSPTEIYQNPSNIFVAGFIGSPAMNFFDAAYSEKELTIENNLKVPLGAGMYKKIHAFYTEKIMDLQRKQSELEAGDDPFKVKDMEELGSKILQYKMKMGEDPIITFGIRPERIHLASPEALKKYGNISLEVEVEVAELLGHEYYVHFRLNGKDTIAKIPASKIVESGDKITLVFDVRKVHVFDPVSGDAIRF